MNSLSCYNGSYTTATSAEGIKNNPDGSTTISKPKLVRGNLEYPFAHKGNHAGICKAMGYENFLAQSAFSGSYGYISRAFVNSEGSFIEINVSENSSLSSITCFNGLYSTVVKDGSGKYYFTRNN